MSIIDQLVHFGRSVVMAFKLINPLLHLGQNSITALNPWFQVLIGTIAGFFIANLILTISSAISSQRIKRQTYYQPVASTAPPIDSFIKSVESSPRPKLKGKLQLPEQASWAQQLQKRQRQREQQEEDDDAKANENNNDDDDDPGETSLFTEDYISETEHNRALSSLQSENSRLIQRINTRDQLLQKSRAETIDAETEIDQLTDEIKLLQTEVQQGKKVIDNLQVSHIEKGKLIYELRAQLVRPTHEVPPEKMNPARWSGQAHNLSHHQPSSSQSHQVALVAHQAGGSGSGSGGSGRSGAASTSASASAAAVPTTTPTPAAAGDHQQSKRAKEVLTYIPPNRRPAPSAQGMLTKM